MEAMERKRPVVITIDGTAASGKSTIARLLAQRLGFRHLETGALYRAVTWYLLQKQIDVRDVEAVCQALKDIRLRLIWKDGIQRTILNEEDVTDYLQEPEVNQHVSIVSAYPCVREFLRDIQRRAGEQENLIAEGRDMGTVIFPDAQLKFFITASAEERARRRFQQLVEQGKAVTFEQVLQEIIQRDLQDSRRPIAPMKPAPDAVLIDTTDKTPDQVVSELVRFVDGLQTLLTH